jgi:hypothetical protein
MSRYPPAAWPIIAVAALVLGWLAATAWFDLAPLRYGGTVEGIVSLVNEDGTKLCIEPADGGRLRCGVVYGPPGASPPTAGRPVAVVVATLQATAGLETEIFVIVEAVD